MLPKCKQYYFFITATTKAYAFKQELLGVENESKMKIIQNNLGCIPWSKGHIPHYHCRVRTGKAPNLICTAIASHRYVICEHSCSIWWCVCGTGGKYILEKIVKYLKRFVIKKKKKSARNLNIYMHYGASPATSSNFCTIWRVNSSFYLLSTYFFKYIFQQIIYPFSILFKYYFFILFLIFFFSIFLHSS